MVWLSFVTGIYVLVMLLLRSRTGVVVLRLGRFGERLLRARCERVTREGPDVIVRWPHRESLEELEEALWQRLQTLPETEERRRRRTRLELRGVQKALQR